MAKPTIYTRVYSESSAGQLASGRTPRGEPLSHAEVLEEFRIHSDRDNREHTALISVSVRIVDTLARAFYKHHVDEEPARDIWFVFIEVPIHNNPDACRIHSAKQLADACGLKDSHLFTYERVFEWAIPEEYVLHKVSLHILINRGLTWESLTGNNPHTQYFSTSSLRVHIAENLRPAKRGDGLWDTGMYLSSLARTFGARAPSKWICNQLFTDCVKIGEADMFDDDHVIVEYIGHGAEENSEIVDGGDFRDMYDAIDLVLIDWWLQDDRFLFEYEEYKKLRTEDEIAIWEAHHWHVGILGEITFVEELSESDKARYGSAQISCAAHWENEAIRIGL